MDRFGRFETIHAGHIHVQQNHGEIVREHLAQAFERLEKLEQEQGMQASAYLSSHPAGAERIARVRAAIR